MASSIRELFLQNSAFWLRLRDFAALFATLVALTEPIFLSASRTNWIRKAIAAIEQAMKRVSQNLARHENGTYYLDIKRGGRQIRRSLETSNQREAKRRLKAELRRLTGESGNQAQSMPIASAEFAELKALISNLHLNGNQTEPKQVQHQKPTFAETVESHFPTIIGF
jgi:hypothetical protein